MTAKNITTTTHLILILLAAFISYRWFTSLSQMGLNCDEVTYTLNSQFYFYRKEADFSRFALPPSNDLTRGFMQVPWWDAKRQVYDQPQLGKYLLGTVLESQDIILPRFSEDDTLYKAFVGSQGYVLPTGENLDTIGKQIGFKLVEAIKISRIIQTASSLLAIIIFSLLVSKLLHSPFLGCLTLLAMGFNHTFSFYYTHATTNGISLLSLLIASIFLAKLLGSYYRHSPLRIFTQSLLAGLLIAVAASIKLNGAFLLIFPLIYFPFLKILQTLEPTLLKSTPFNGKKALLSSLSIIVGFISTFIYLEPELWPTPLKGFKYLFLGRTRQQQLFTQAWGEIPLTKVFYHLLYYSLNFGLGEKLLFPALILTLFLIVLGFFYLLNRKSKDKTGDLILILFSLLTVCSITFYGRIDHGGFERYYVPAIMIFYLLAAFGLKSLSQKLIGSLPRFFP